jgi:hypothetical protein
MWAPWHITTGVFGRVFEQIINLQPGQTLDNQAGTGVTIGILLLQSRKKLRIVFGKVQTYNVNGMASPDARQFNAGNQLNVVILSGKARRPQAVKGIVIG